jgi:predicted transcriptional regulator
MSLIFTKGESQTLLALEDKQLKSFTEILNLSELTRPSLSDSLKSLQIKEYIERDVMTRKYRLLGDNGRVAVKIIEIVNYLNKILESHDLTHYEKLIDDMQDMALQQEIHG